jgi:hypothetical protein
MRASKPIVLAMCIALAAAAAQAQTVYKWVDKDGKVHFGDTPPMDRDATAQRVPSGGPSTDEQLPYATQVAMKKNPVVMYASGGCGEMCSKGRELLSRRGIPFTEKHPETNPDDAKALRDLVGALVVPVVSVGSNTLRGFDEDQWQAALDEAGYAKSRLPGQPAPKTQ